MDVSGSARPLDYYNSLSRAQLSYDYLHTNSTTHEFLFGAIVELVDNARDAHAKNMSVYTIDDERLRGEKILAFQDDGCGMSRQEAASVMTFGYSGKRLDPAMVGQYGNGLKSGAMRIGKDFILFTKKDDIMTVVFLSRTFHEKEKIDEVIVPMPSFTTDKVPYHDATPEEKLKFDTEMELLLEYSPFHSKEELLAQFDRITSPSGTIVMVYNLRLGDSGDPELDFVSDPVDIRLPDNESGDKRLVLERTSLRAYLAIVYADPRMKIYVQGEKVRTRRVISCLYKPRQYKFTSSRFKARAEKEAIKAKEMAKTAGEKKMEADSKLRDFEKRNGASPGDRGLRIEWRRLQDAATQANSEAKACDARAKEKERSKNEPKILTFTFGINLENRSHDGCMVYNNGRLIRMYEQAGAQLDGGVEEDCRKASGVIGVVDVPYVVLEPTHNKQNFADAKEYRFLMTVFGQHIDQYWKDLNLAAQSGGVLQFWRNFGYQSNVWQDPPSDDKTTKARRFMSVNLVVQCGRLLSEQESTQPCILSWLLDHCLKWRLVPPQPALAEKELPVNWLCADNPDKSLAKCDIPEKKLTIPLGKLEKTQLSVEEVEKKREQLQKNIEKEKAKLDRLEATSTRSTPKQKDPPPSRTSGSSRRRSPSPSPQPAPKSSDKPKTKAALRAQYEKERREAEEKAKAKMEKERERKRREKETELKRQKAEQEKKRKSNKNRMEEEKKRAREVEERKKAAAKRTGRAARIVDESDEEEEEEEAQETPTRYIARRNSPRATASSRSAASSSPQKEAVASPSRRSSRGKSGRKEAESGEGEVEVVAPPPLKKARPSDSGRAKRNDDGEAPSSSVNQDSPAPEVSSTTADRERMEKMGKQLRRCLSFFHPPGWNVSKKELAALSLDEITHLDLDTFFKAYELSLTNLVNQHRREADEMKTTLAKLRANSVRLMRHFSKDFAVEGSSNQEQVDLMMEECVRQLNEGRDVDTKPAE